MTPTLLRRAGIAAFVLAIITLGQAGGYPSPEVVSLGDKTYSVTAKAHSKFTRNTDKLKTQATAIATEFCTKQGKRLKVISVVDDKSMYLVGSDMTSATLTFKALDPLDPELATRTGTGETAAPVTNETMYADLLRLDELHKKGILDDDEFKSEKKKVLDRSK